MKHGYGHYTWPDKSVFQGDWVENVISGFGKYQWNDGRVYEGYWLNNDMHG